MAKKGNRKMYDVSVQVNEYKEIKNSPRVRFIQTNGLYPCVIMYNKKVAHTIAKKMIKLARCEGLFNKRRQK